jgi:hypothetical protein
VALSDNARMSQRAPAQGRVIAGYAAALAAPVAVTAALVPLGGGVRS